MKKAEISRGPGASWDEILGADSRPVPEFLRDDTYEYMGSEPVAASRYTSADFFRAEIEKMWPRVWQYAAREEDIPGPGDFTVYENAGRSYLIARQPDGTVKAFHNVCLHRGRKLKSGGGRASQFKCPFHGFTWNADGSFKEMPCRWDFPKLRDEDLQLPEAAVGRWGGYIFVREALEGPSLAEYLAPLPEHYARYRHEDCVTAVWVGKVVDANWKVAAEAFMEAFHVLVTHPQILSFTGDTNSRSNIYGDHVNAMLTAFAVPSPHLEGKAVSEQSIVDDFAKFASRKGSENLAFTVAEGQTARQALAAINRQRFAEMFGGNYEDAADTEILDSYLYNVFPNFAPWGGFMPNVVYRWRPWPDQDHALMDVRVLVRVKEGAPRPRGVPMRFLGPDEPWTAAAELGVQAAVFEQDMGNMPLVQEGLKASKTGRVHFADYQEIRIRHFHRTLDKYLAG